MTGRQDYSQIEWQLLAELPFLVIGAVASVEPDSEREAAFELLAGVSELARGAELRQSVPLVQAVMTDLETREGQLDRETPISQNQVRQIESIALLRASQVASILAEKAEPDEAEAYATWLLWVAEAVALAAKTGGGPLGIGGTRVTDAEAAFLEDLADAFGVPGLESDQS